MVDNAQELADVGIHLRNDPELVRSIVYGHVLPCPTPSTGCRGSKACRKCELRVIWLLIAVGNTVLHVQQTAFRGKNFDLAIEKYQAAIDVAPDSAVLYSNLSASLLGANRLAESIEASQKAITVRRHALAVQSLLKTVTYAPAHSRLSSSTQLGLNPMYDLLEFTRS